MFTGIVEEVGKVQNFRSKGRVWELELNVQKIYRGLKIGDSVAVNGVCLTVVKKSRRNCLFELQQETLKCTNLGELKKGDPVNLEQAISAAGRFDGHIVQGHVDTVGRVSSLKKKKKDIVLEIGLKNKFLKYCVPKGSITLNGVSLTLVGVKKNSFSVHLIPHTLKVTNLRNLQQNGKVNIEIDILAKYIEKLLKKR